MNLYRTGIAAALPIITILGCGHPLEPTQENWKVIYKVKTPLETTTLTAFQGEVLFNLDSDSLDKTACIMASKNGVIRKVYEVKRKGVARSYITALDATSDTVWAAGYREYDPVGGGSNESGRESFLLFFNGREWQEIDIPSNISIFFDCLLSPARNGACWFTAYNKLSEKKEVFKYDSGQIIPYPSLPTQIIFFDPLSSTVFAIGPNGRNVITYRSADNGTTWESTAVPLPVPFTRFQPEPVNVVSDAEYLYIITRDYNRKPDDYAIHRINKSNLMSSNLLFYAPEGPYFNWLRSIAGAPDGRVIAVGHHTSAYYDGDKWLLEELPMKNSFDDVVWGGDGFYAVADNGMSMPRRTELLYHP